MGAFCFKYRGWYQRFGMLGLFMGLTGDAASSVEQELCLKGVAYSFWICSIVALLLRMRVGIDGNWNGENCLPTRAPRILALTPNSSEHKRAVYQAAGFPLDGRVESVPPCVYFSHNGHVLSLYEYPRLLDTPYVCREPPSYFTYEYIAERADASISQNLGVGFAWCFNPPRPLVVGPRIKIVSYSRD